MKLTSLWILYLRIRVFMLNAQGVWLLHATDVISLFFFYPFKVVEKRKQKDHETRWWISGSADLLRSVEATPTLFNRQHTTLSFVFYLWTQSTGLWKRRQMVFKIKKERFKKFNAICWCKYWPADSLSIISW